MSSSPTTPGQTSLIPMNDCILVKLDAATLKETKYSTRTSGICVKLPFTGVEAAVNDLTGKRVYFEEYKEGARIKRDGELFCFIKISDIRGYEDV
jgi:hypothetical protein